ILSYNKKGEKSQPSSSRLSLYLQQKLPEF
ncbi:unnamed protein product, partial [marine sediment metagenome]